MEAVAVPRCGPSRPALCSSLLWQGLSLAVSPSGLPVALSPAPAPVPWAGEARTCWPVSQEFPSSVSGGNQDSPALLGGSLLAPRAPWLRSRTPGQKGSLALLDGLAPVLQQVWLLWGLRCGRLLFSSMVWMRPCVLLGVCMVHKGAMLMMSHFIFCDRLGGGYCEPILWMRGLRLHRVQ